MACLKHETNFRKSIIEHQIHFQNGSTTLKLPHVDVLTTRDLVIYFNKISRTTRNYIFREDFAVTGMFIKCKQLAHFSFIYIIF